MEREIDHDKRIHALLDDSSDPIFSLDRQGRYLYVNTIFATTLGKTQETIIGKTLWETFPCDEADKRFDMVEKMIRTGKMDTIEVVIPLEGTLGLFCLMGSHSSADIGFRVSAVW